MRRRSGKCPRLLESGVPEAMLLHILAPVPSAGHDEPVPQPARADVPARRTMPRASLTAAVEAMAPHGGKPPWLPSTPTCWRPRRDGPWSESGEAGEFDLSARRQHIIAGALRIGHYRSAGLYLDAAIWHQENQLHTPVSAALRRAAKTLTKAALRGLPGSRLKQAFDLDELAQLVVQDEADEPFDVTRVEHAVDVVVVATWFMLREIEIAGTKVKDLTVTGTTVSLDIPLHKTAQGGQTELTPRTFRCVCVSAAHPLCPRFAAWPHIDASWRRRPAGLTTSSSLPGPALSGPRQNRRRCSGCCIFGGHAARVAGATFLAAKGVADGRRRQSNAMRCRHHWQWRRAFRPRRCWRPAHTHSPWVGPPSRRPRWL